jgi:GntR family transcriptional regulator
MLEIDASSPVPAYEQIVSRIQLAVADGVLRPGAPLPPIRQLARDLELNPATVAKAYQILEKDGILATAGRKGTFVREDARPKVDESLRNEAGDQIRDLLTRWKARGLALRDLRKLFNETLSRMETLETR